MVRELNGHSVKGEAIQLRVLALDNPDDSGASHQFRFERDDGSQVGAINFHTGVIEPHAGLDVNGVTMEALIVVMIDRLKGFQKGENPHKQNDFARKRLEEALKALQGRTEELLEKSKESKEVAVA